MFGGVIMLVKLFRWLKGFLRIKLKGQSPERFFNLCSNHHIYLWNIMNIEGVYECNIMLSDYKKIKAIAKKTHTIPLIMKRNGLPFKAKFYEKRKGFLIGILLFVSIVYILSLYIWDISILGGHTYTPEAMTKFLKNHSVFVGMKKNDINAQNIEELIRLTYKDIGWVSCEVKGTRLIIKIEETKIPEPYLKINENSHIIAAKDSIITDIVTRTGTPLVKIGDVVKKGDTLVSGVVDIVGDNDILVEKKPVIADADILGKTFYEYKDVFPVQYLEKQYTGNVKKAYTLNLMLEKINIYKPRNIYPKYDIIVEDYMLHFNNNFYLPVGYTITTYPEYIEIKKKYSKEEAIAKATSKLNRFLDKLKEEDVLILENNVKISMDNKNVVAQGKIIVLESIMEYKTVNDDEWRNIEVDESSGNNN